MILNVEIPDEIAAQVEELHRASAEHHRTCRECDHPALPQGIDGAYAMLIEHGLTCHRPVLLSPHIGPDLVASIGATIIEEASSGEDGARVTPMLAAAHAFAVAIGIAASRPAWARTIAEILRRGDEGDAGDLRLMLEYSDAIVSRIERGAVAS